MLKQSFSRIKKVLTILLAVFFVATLTVASASACSYNGHAGSNSCGYSNYCDHNCNSNKCSDYSNGCISGYSNSHNNCEYDSCSNGCISGCSNSHSYECE